MKAILVRTIMRWKLQDLHRWLKYRLTGTTESTWKAHYYDTSNQIE